MRCEAALQSEPRREGSLIQAYCLAWELFHYRVEELIICCLCVNDFFCVFYAGLWRFRGLLCASSRLLRRMCDASLAACIPSSQ